MTQHSSVSFVLVYAVFSSHTTQVDMKESLNYVPLLKIRTNPQITAQLGHIMKLQKAHSKVLNLSVLLCNVYAYAQVDSTAVQRRKVTNGVRGEDTEKFKKLTVEVEPSSLWMLYVCLQSLKNGTIANFWSISSPTP